MSYKLTKKSLSELHKIAGNDVMNIILDYHNDIYLNKLFDEQRKKIYKYLNKELTSNYSYVSDKTLIINAYPFIEEQIQRIMIDHKIICKIGYIRTTPSKILFNLTTNKNWDENVKRNSFFKILHSNFKFKSNIFKYCCYVKLN
jgi:hypothetical protein